MVPISCKTNTLRALLMCFIFIQVFSLRAHTSHVNFGSHDHSMTSNCEFQTLILKYKSPLHSEMQFITEVFIGYLTNLC